MAGIIKAFATDLDGTLTQGDRVAPATLDALQDARACGIATILVTGRITEDLDDHFPGLRQAFDAVVTENGAVLETPARDHPPAPRRSTTRSRRGPRVGASTCGPGTRSSSARAEHAPTCLDLVTELGVDAQLLRNRERLMILPAGVSKRSGLLSALHELGLSPHNVLAVGDAENDLALLDTAEIGGGRRERRPVGEGARRPRPRRGRTARGWSRSCAAPCSAGGHLVRSTRHDVVIGTYADGSPVRVPATRANVLVCGDERIGQVPPRRPARRAVGPGRLHRPRHRCRGRLPRPRAPRRRRRPRRQPAAGLPGAAPAAPPALHLRRPRPLPDTEHQATAYLRDLAAIIDAERSAWGLPHWVLIDEAHTPLGLGGAMEGLLRPGDEGYCLVTYRPEELPEAVLHDMDVVITTPAPGSLRPSVRPSLRRAGGSERPSPSAPAPRRTCGTGTSTSGRRSRGSTGSGSSTSGVAVIATAENIETFLRTIETARPRGPRRPPRPRRHLPVARRVPPGPPARGGGRRPSSATSSRSGRSTCTGALPPHRGHRDRLRHTGPRPDPTGLTRRPRETGAPAPRQSPVCRSPPPCPSSPTTTSGCAPTAPRTSRGSSSRATTRSQGVSRRSPARMARRAPGSFSRPSPRAGPSPADGGTGR